jgi:hypothetical protein
VRLDVNFGARCDAAAIAPFFSSLCKMQRLRELRITSWVPYAPQKGSAPLGCYAPLELGGVTSLVVDGAALSANDMLVRTRSGCTGSCSTPQRVGVGPAAAGSLCLCMWPSLTHPIST